jgi:hypothetical protein
LPRVTPPRPRLPGYSAFGAAEGISETGSASIRAVRFGCVRPGALQLTVGGDGSRSGLGEADDPVRVAVEVPKQLFALGERS